MKKKIIIISSPSGAGKTTICKKLLTKNKSRIKDLNILQLRAEDLSLREIIEIFNEYSQL